MILKSFHRNQGSFFGKDRKSNDLGSSTVSNKYKQSTDISKSPYTNMIPSSLT